MNNKNIPPHTITSKIFSKTHKNTAINRTLKKTIQKSVYWNIQNHASFFKVPQLKKHIII